MGNPRYRLKFRAHEGKRISQSELNANTRGRLHDRDTERWFPPKYIDGAFKAIQSTLRALAMHPNKRRYKICICSVILGELESF